MTELSRRDVLGATAAVGATGLAGCLGALVEDDSDPADGTGDTGGDDNDAEGGRGDGNGGDSHDSSDVELPAGVAAVSVETTAADCGGPEDDYIDADVDEDVVRVVGTLPAPNPCHEAILAGIDLDDGELSLVIDVEDTTEADEECAQCHGAVDYETVVELENGTTVETVDVRHETGGGHAAAWDSASGTAVDLQAGEYSIETRQTGCQSSDLGVADASIDDDVVTVDGVIEASNPCHEATLEGVTIENQQLSLRIDVASTLAEGEVCQQCLGQVAYRATVEVAEASQLEDVTVDHATDGPHTISVGDNDHQPDVNRRSPDSRDIRP